jgi:hypothetical protein
MHMPPNDREERVMKDSEVTGTSAKVFPQIALAASSSSEGLETEIPVVLSRKAWVK